jgi:dTDP-4-amino-4,6-dideoxygalactose transaminase
MIQFNNVTVLAKETEYMYDAVYNEKKISGDGKYTKLCHRWIEDKMKTSKALLTTSCSSALEMSAILAGIKKGDEVIMPSYTFVSTANAFVLKGAEIHFVDIRPDTMNMDENLIEQAVTPRTKVIVPVHYAGVSCEMDTILQIARKYNLLVIEDAAQGVMAKYKGRYLGTMGNYGCLSFHDTKNYSMGEGGAILFRDSSDIERAEIIREKGTNRNKFLRGEVDKYSWIDIGSSYLPSDLNAAFLWAQLEVADEINSNRLSIWNSYKELLEPLENQEYIEIPHIPKDCEHNAHIFWIKTRNLEERTELMEAYRKKLIHSTFHYIPLHSSIAGLKYGRFIGEDKYTTKESERILRLPLYYGMKEEDILSVYECIKNFYS